jgi:hypothetical protein
MRTGAGWGTSGEVGWLQPGQSSLAKATPGHCQKPAKRTFWSPLIVNEDSSPQVMSMGRAIFVVTGQWPGWQRIALCGSQEGIKRANCGSQAGIVRG